VVNDIPPFVRTQPSPSNTPLNISEVSLSLNTKLKDLLGVTPKSISHLTILLLQKTTEYSHT
jgi:hypothetical protein